MAGMAFLGRELAWSFSTAACRDLRWIHVESAA